MITQIIHYLKSGDVNVIIKKKDKEILEIDLKGEKVDTKILDFVGLLEMIDDIAPELLEFIGDVLKKGYGFKLK
ncbi:MAG: hypothetical protein GOU97_01575 [Nanoarchaeota archaeon]|nr:hypothetical protein [Nanoarchaeota archaeon]